MKLDSSYLKKYVLEELRKKGRGVKIIILSSNIIWAVYECDKRSNSKGLWQSTQQRDSPFDTLCSWIRLQGGGSI